MVALNFADEKEASSFYDVVYTTITSRARKERRNINPYCTPDNDENFYGETQVLQNNQYSRGKLNVTLMTG